MLYGGNNVRNILAEIVEKKKDIVALVNVLHSKAIQDWIRTKYKGAVIPVNN